MGIKEELKPVPTSVVHRLSQDHEHITANKLFFPPLLAFFSVLHLSHSVLLYPRCALLTFAFSCSISPQLTEDIICIHITQMDGLLSAS